MARCVRDRGSREAGAGRVGDGGKIPVRRRAVLLGALVLIAAARLVSLIWRGDRVRLYADEQRTLASVLERVPVGSTVVHALEVMERSRFKCSLQRNVVGPDLRSVSLLNCRRDTLTWSIVVERNWGVVFYLAGDNDETVREVRVSYALTAF
jgi:hypothetical protein